MPLPLIAGAAPWVTYAIYAAIASMITGGSIVAGQEIADKIKEKKKEAEYAEKPDIKKYPKGTAIHTNTNEDGSKEYTIVEPGKAAYKFEPKISPIKFSDKTITQIDNLPPNERKLLDTIINIMQEDPLGFNKSIEQIDTQKLEQAAQGKLPSAEEMGFPPNTNVINELMQSTEFGPIEEEARSKFHHQTIPKIAEQFAGMNALSSSAFKNELGRASSDLESKLAALKSQYGLQRANTLGGLSQKQQALDVGRAQAIGNLGLAQQGQQFGQQQALANLGLQQQQLNLGQQSQRNQLLAQLLGAGQYQTAGTPQKGLGLGGALIEGGAKVAGGLLGSQFGYNPMLPQSGQTDIVKQMNDIQKGL